MINYMFTLTDHIELHTCIPSRALIEVNTTSVDATIETFRRFNGQSSRGL